MRRGPLMSPTHRCRRRRVRHRWAKLRFSCFSTGRSLSILSPFAITQLYPSQPVSSLSSGPLLPPRLSTPDRHGWFYRSISLSLCRIFFFYASTLPTPAAQATPPPPPPRVSSFSPFRRAVAHYFYSCLRALSLSLTQLRLVFVVPRRTERKIKFAFYQRKRRRWRGLKRHCKRTSEQSADCCLHW